MEFSYLRKSVTVVSVGLESITRHAYGLHPHTFSTLSGLLEHAESCGYARELRPFEKFQLVRQNVLFLPCFDLQTRNPSSGGSAQEGRTRHRGSARSQSRDSLRQQHVGSHPEYCRWMFSTAESQSCVRDNVGRVADFLAQHDQSSDPLLIATVCKWGKHRSVAMGASLADALRDDPGLAVSGSSASHWG